MISFNEIVGQSVSGEVYFLDHIFDDNGRIVVGGSIYRPVMVDEWKEATSDYGLERNLGRWWKEARRRGDPRGVREFTAALFAEKGEGSIWDLGDPIKANMARAFTGLSTIEAPVFACCGGGMCIDGSISWSRIVNHERLFRLLDLVKGRREAWDYFVKCI